MYAKVQNRYIFLPLFGLTPRRRGSFGTISVKLYRRVTDGQGTKWCRNVTENFNRLSRVHERYRRQTDDRRQTDRQTDDRRTDDDI